MKIITKLALVLLFVQSAFAQKTGHALSEEELGKCLGDPEVKQALKNTIQSQDFLETIQSPEFKALDDVPAVLALENIISESIPKSTPKSDATTSMHFGGWKRSDGYVPMLNSAGKEADFSLQYGKALVFDLECSHSNQPSADTFAMYVEFIDKNGIAITKDDRPLRILLTNSFYDYYLNIYSQSIRDSTFAQSGYFLGGGLGNLGTGYQVEMHMNAEGDVHFNVIDKTGQVVGGNMVGYYFALYPGANLEGYLPKNIQTPIKIRLLSYVKDGVGITGIENAGIKDTASLPIHPSRPTASSQILSIAGIVGITSFVGSLAGDAAAAAVQKFRNFWWPVQNQIERRMEQIERPIATPLESTKTDLQKYVEDEGLTDIVADLQFQKKYDVPHEFFDPVSTQFMLDPVSDDAGHTYDRPEITRWLELGNRMDPLTRQPISDKLVPNITLRKLMKEELVRINKMVQKSDMSGELDKAQGPKNRV